MQTPIQTRPLITNIEVRNKFVTRYFVQMISTKNIYEVDKVQYDFFSNNSYYTAIQLPWIIVGKIDNETVGNNLILGVKDKNLNIVDYYNQTMQGLKRKLRNPLEYYVQP